MIWESLLMCMDQRVLWQESASLQLIMCELLMHKTARAIKTQQFKAQHRSLYQHKNAAYVKDNRHLFPWTSAKTPCSLISIIHSLCLLHNCALHWQCSMTRFREWLDHEPLSSCWLPLSGQVPFIIAITHFQRSTFHTLSIFTWCCFSPCNRHQYFLLPARTRWVVTSYVPRYVDLKMHLHFWPGLSLINDCSKVWHASRLIDEI